MTRKQLGEFVKQQRILQNMTQQELADKAGFSRRQVVVEIENDQCDYGISVILKVLDALGFVLMPTISPRQIPKLNVSTLLDFSKIEVAREEDDPRLQEKKKKRIFAHSQTKK
jgi:transcriptional regulator with XRE-family HTH domain